MRTYKVVIFIANIGGGHMAPAKAIAELMHKSKKAKFEVKIIDLFKMSDVAPFNTADVAYRLFTDNWTLQTINNIAFNVVNAFFPLYESIFTSRLISATEEIMRAEDPDLVIANHPDVSAALNVVKRTSGGFFYCSQITDAHIFMRGAISESADKILAPTEDVIQKLKKFDIPRRKIIGPGYTINSRFGNPADRNKFLSEIGLSTEKPIVLLTAGGAGFHSVVSAVEDLAKVSDWQLVVMCGRMSDLAVRLREQYAALERVKIFDFVDNMGDFYNAADVVISKPGMSAVIESEMLQKKTIFTRPLAEQERGNLIYAMRSPLNRYISRDWSKLIPTIKELLQIDMPDWRPRHHVGETKAVVEELIEAFLDSTFAARAKRQNSL